MANRNDCLEIKQPAGRMICAKAKDREEKRKSRVEANLLARYESKCHSNGLWRANNGSRGSTNKQINQSARRAYASFRQDHDDHSGEEDACGRVGISAVMYVVGTNLLRAG